MKKRLIILIVLVLIFGGGYVYASNNNWLPASAPKPPTTIPKITTDQATIQTFKDNTGSSLNTLSGKLQELGNHAKNVFQTGIQVDEQQPPLHERAIEYGQYVYCKQVVKEYEQAAIIPIENLPNVTPGISPTSNP